MQLKQPVLLPAASARPRVVQSTICPVASWQSASWHIRELSSYWRHCVRWGPSSP